MPRDFNGTSDKLKISSAILSATEFTLFGWFNSDVIDATATVIGIGSSSTDTPFWQIRLSADGKVVIQARDDAGNLGTGTSATSTYSSDTWTHLLGTFQDAAREIFVDGVSKASETTALGATTVDQTGIGILPRISDGNFLNGELAWVGVYNVALVAGEISALASGVNPMRIRPDALVSLVPVWGAHSPEVDLMFGSSWTVTGAAKSSPGPNVEHYPFQYPKHVAKFAAVAAITAAEIAAAAQTQIHYIEQRLPVAVGF